MYYRVYLVGFDDHFRAAEHFSAKNDLEAEEIAQALYQSCSTSFRGVELWQGSRLMVRRVDDQQLPIDDHQTPVVDLRRLLDARQESVAQLEEALERSFHCVHESQQLISTLEKIRSR